MRAAWCRRGSDEEDSHTWKTGHLWSRSLYDRLTGSALRLIGLCARVPSGPTLIEGVTWFPRCRLFYIQHGLRVFVEFCSASLKYCL